MKGYKTAMFLTNQDVDRMIMVGPPYRKLTDMKYENGTFTATFVKEQSLYGQMDDTWRSLAVSCAHVLHWHRGLRTWQSLRHSPE